MRITIGVLVAVIIVMAVVVGRASSPPPEGYDSWEAYHEESELRVLELLTLAQELTEERNQILEQVRQLESEVARPEEELSPEPPPGTSGIPDVDWKNILPRSGPGYDLSPGT